MGWLGGVLKKLAPNSKKDGKIQKSFSLPKEGHTVFVIAKDGNIKINIHSDRELEILSMLADAKSQVASDNTKAPLQRNQIINDLEGARQTVLSMNQDWKSTPNKTQDFATWAEVRLAQIVNLLAHLGADGIKAFSDFKGKPLEKRFLPVGFDVRQRLYIIGSSWSGNQAAIVRKGRADLLNDVNTVVRIGITNPNIAIDARNCLRMNLLIPDGATMNTIIIAQVSNNQYDVDHKVAFSIHWQSNGGNNNNDSTRWKISDSSNLRYITKSNNIALIKGKYDNWVGKSFISFIARWADKCKKDRWSTFLGCSRWKSNLICKNLFFNYNNPPHHAQNNLSKRTPCYRFAKKNRCRQQQKKYPQNPVLAKLV